MIINDKVMAEKDGFMQMRSKSDEKQDVKKGIWKVHEILWIYHIF